MTATDTATLFIDSKCELGEGVFWHPLLDRLFWFDIINKTLHSATANGIMVDRFVFDAPVSAAGIIDADHLAIASAGGIYRLQLSTDTRELIVPLEPNKNTRSNDGRVNRAGGFWISTMSRTDPSRNAGGSLYQLRDGQLAQIRSNIRVPNSTAFSPDGRTAYFTDGLSRLIEQCAIDPESGMPAGPWRPFVKVSMSIEPDGSVVDSAGFLWNCEWNGGRVVRYAPDGAVDRVVALPVSRPTCPAFGGPDLKTLYITSARDGLSAEELAKQPGAGGIFSIRVDVPGQPETLLKM
jgi:sugar lactone lactonase YvrE